MPKMDGYEVIDEINKYPELRGTPFIYLTALATRDDFRKGMTQGADDYITKPFKLKDLIEAITAQEKKVLRLEDRINRMLNELSDRASFSDIFPETKSGDLTEKAKEQIGVNSNLNKLMQVNNSINTVREIIEKSIKEDKLTDEEMIMLEKLKSRLTKKKIRRDSIVSFLARFDNIFPGFSLKLHNTYPDLSREELFICAAVVMKLHATLVSQIIGIETASVYKKKYRLVKKLGLSSTSQLPGLLEKYK